MGIKTHLDGYPAEALGGLTLGVSPLEMADAYATIASGGYRNRPTAITKGTFPAEIWHDYMSKGKGKFCGGFKRPSTPFQASPFFGRYSRSGGRGTGQG